MKQNTLSYKIKQYLMFGGAGTVLFLAVVIAPFLYGLYWKRTTSASVWASFIAGVAVMCGCMYCTFTGKTFICPYFTSPINAGVLAMSLGLVIVPVVSLFTKVNRKESVEKMFKCYDNTVTVRASTSLVEEQE